MAKQWSGKSKGSVLGYKFFVFCIKNLGIRASYLILYFVALYYFLFSYSNNKVIFYYFKERLGFPYFKSKLAVYKSYFVFGQTLIDKVAISSGLRDRFTYTFDGSEKLVDLLDKKKGGILISAHVGNFETAKYFFSDIDLNSQINLVTTDVERQEIKQYIDSVSSHNTSIKFIIVKEDLSHVYEINNAISNNELVCFTGDRFFEGAKFLKAKFLNEEAKFPAGPFLLASRLNTPVAFVYVMKGPKLHYNLSTTIVNVKHRDAMGLLSEYIASIESIIKKYPYQWFNYYDFWEKN